MTDGQLSRGLRDEELGESVEHDDLDMERADRLRDELWEAVMGAVSKPRPCRCERPLLDRRDWDGAMHCVRCGREVAHGG